MVGSSFHSHVHMLRPLLERSCGRNRPRGGTSHPHGSCVYAEIGSFCGASLGLALSFPGLTRAVSISIDEAGLILGHNTSDALRKNVRCLNIRNRCSVHLINKPSSNRSRLEHMHAGRVRSRVCSGCPA